MPQIFVQGLIVGSFIFWRDFPSADLATIRKKPNHKTGLSQSEVSRRSVPATCPAGLVLDQKVEEGSTVVPEIWPNNLGLHKSSQFALWKERPPIFHVKQCRNITIANGCSYHIYIYFVPSKIFLNTLLHLKKILKK